MQTQVLFDQPHYWNQPMRRWVILSRHETCYFHPCCSLILICPLCVLITESGVVKGELMLPYEQSFINIECSGRKHGQYCRIFVRRHSWICIRRDNKLIWNVWHAKTEKVLTGSYRWHWKDKYFARSFTVKDGGTNDFYLKDEMKKELPCLPRRLSSVLERTTYQSRMV